jgi:hypothetical protein
MFRSSLAAVARQTAKQATQQSGRRFNSSHAAPKSGDAKWALSAVAVTVPALAYLLAPASKKADAHKAVHVAQAKVGLKTEEEAEDAIKEIGDEVHGPESRSDPARLGKSQDPAEQAKQASKTSSKPNSNKEGLSSGDIKAKQGGISNTETKHKVSVVTKDGENPTAKSQETINPSAPRGKEKHGRSATPAKEEEEEEDDDEDEEEDEEDDDEEEEEEENKK